MEEIKWKKFLFSLCLIVSSLVLTSCNNNETFTENTYLATDEVLEINIDVNDKLVNVNVTDNTTVSITYYTSEKSGYDISLNNGILNIVDTYNKEFGDFIGVQANINYRTLNVNVPSTLLNNLSVKTTNENINITNINSTNISLDCNNGDIVVSNINIIKETSLNIKNGNINGDIYGDYADFIVTCDIKKGNTNLINTMTGTKILNVSSNNGDVNINFI